jgi:hypothetical protein
LSGRTEQNDDFFSYICKDNKQNMKKEVKVGMLISYDYELVKNSLPLIYEHADKIVLAADKDGKTWAGNDLHISDEFWQWVKDFDTQQKIEIYKDSFYVEGLTTIQCDTRQRNMLGNYMGKGGWHVQIDADEYFIDFKHFVDFLHYLDRKKRHINCVRVELLTLYKRTSSGFLFIKETKGGIACPYIATTIPRYITARNIVRPRRTAFYSQRAIHDSYARSEQDLWTKFSNWGHNSDFDIEGYFHYWKAIDEKNYMFVRNFAPIEPHDAWVELDYLEGKSIQDVIQVARTSNLIVAKRQHKIIRYLSWCIPPIFFKIYKMLFK